MSFVTDHGKVEVAARPWPKLWEMTAAVVTGHGNGMHYFLALPYTNSLKQTNILIPENGSLEGRYLVSFWGSRLIVSCKNVSFREDK